MLKLIITISSSLILLLSGCGERLSALKTSNVDNAFATIPQEVPQSSSPTPPSVITDALIPDFNQSLLTESASSGLASFNISVHEVEARDFFMSLVADSQENIVVHPDVSGRISLELKNVTIAQVLSTVQKVYGYDYTKTDVGYIIYPAILQTKMFKVDRLDLQREGNSNTRVTSGQINSGPRNNVSQAGGIGQSAMMNPTGGANSGGGANNSSNSGSWITTTSHTDFWAELQESLLAIVNVSSSNNHDEFSNTLTGNKVVINKQTGIVVVRSNPTQMREVEHLIASTQQQIGRQVAIEAKILEITLNDRHQNGVNWGDIIHKAQATLMSGMVPASAATAAAAFTIGVKSGDFYAFIELMEAQGKTNILSSPRISTLNNQKAVIKVGQDQYFITNVSSNNSLAGANSVVTQDVTWTPFFNGIALDVTPQISDSNAITLHIHPTVTIVSVDEKSFSINGQDNHIPMALNKVRESDSIVQAEDGQIIVIGGLLQTNIQENQQGVTLLAQIPYLGNLFRENTGTGQKSELVILLKPTVINANTNWAPALENSRQHLQQLERKKLWK